MPTGCGLLGGGRPHRVGFILVGVCTCRGHPLGVALVGLVRGYSIVISGQPPGVLVPGPLKRTPMRQRSATAYDFQGLPGMSYKMICGWLLPILNLEATGRGCAVNRICPGAA